MDSGVMKEATLRSTVWLQQQAVRPRRERGGGGMIVLKAHQLRETPPEHSRGSRPPWVYGMQREEDARCSERKEGQKQSTGLPWWRSGWESACRCRGHGFEPWSGKIPHAAGQLGLCATTTEPARLEPVFRNKRGRDSERPAHRDEEWPPLAAARESPRTEMKTQHSQKNKQTKNKVQNLGLSRVDDISLEKPWMMSNTEKESQPKKEKRLGN